MLKPPQSAPTPPNFPWLLVLVMALAGLLVGVWFALQQRIDRLEAELRMAGDHLNDEALGDYPVINGHDHLYRQRHLANYLPAADRLGIEKTVFVASSAATLLGPENGEADADMEWNTREILAAAKANPGKIIAFATVHPGDPEKLAKLKQYVAEGVQGLKLYTGHGMFHDRALDAPEMDEIYAYCQAERLPILWHVRLDQYEGEFTRVMDKYPDLIVVVPHYGVLFYRPAVMARQIPPLLEKYPHLYFDTSFGTRSILVHGLEIVSADPNVFRNLFTAYPNRFIFGTDMVVTGNTEKTEAWVAAVIRACRDMFEKDRYTFYMAAEGSPYALARANNTYGRLRGLNLPPQLLERVYHKNLEAILALRSGAPENSD